MRRLCIAIAAAAMGCSPSWADTVVEPYELLHVTADRKLKGAVVYGEIMIYVDTNSPDEALATADAVARQLINDEVFGAVKVFAFTPRRTREDSNGLLSEKNGTAWVSFSGHPGFQSDWQDWRHEWVRNSRIVTTTFDRSAWMVPASFSHVSAKVEDLCPDLTRCSAGRDPRLTGS